jgi:hypothetical protein
MLEELAATADDARSVVSRAEGLLREIADHLAALRQGTHVSDPVVGRVECLLSEIVGQGDDPKSLRRYSGQVYSEIGENGIIAESFCRIGGPQSRVSIEMFAAVAPTVPEQP